MEHVPREYALDAGALLNLLASRRLADFATSIPARLIVARAAAGEIAYVRRGGGGPDVAERDPIDPATLEQARFLTIVDLTTPTELGAFVAFAAEMDDGEAATGALAIGRGAIVVTDDRKARSVFARCDQPLPLSTTSEIVRAWADRANPDAEELAKMLIDIEARARFRPGPWDPLEAWWKTTRERK